MNLPNGLTVARIIVTPAIAALPFVDSSNARLFAFLLFLAAAISDWFDGYYARRRKQETDLGRMLDPLADKLLLVGTFVPMYFMSHRFEFLTPFGDYDLPWWVVAIILGREVTMTWFRQFAARRGVVIAAIWPAKWKTAIQLIWSGTAYFWFYLATLMVERGWTGPISRTIGMICGTIGAVSMLLALALTLYSLFIYVRNYGYLLRVKPVVQRTLLVLAAAWGARTADAQLPGARDSVPPTAHAVRAAGQVRIDGRLDEPAWAAAPAYSRFTQIDPEEGRPARQRTDVRVLFDDEALYVGYRLHDTEPGRIIARLGRRDMSLGDSDWVGVMIDSYHDHRTAFGFDVNPAGVRRDEIKTITSDDNSWDAVWEVATSIDAGGWVAEYRIPFSQLRFSTDSVQTWGIQFERIVGRTKEYSVSTFIPKRESGGVPRYGHLAGVRVPSGGSRVELLPYTATRAEYVEPGANPYRTRREYFGTAGLDLSYRVASNVTLNATVNPDFGQVEVDPAVVNLGVYETFFEEKRPFFLEGSEIFNFGEGNTSGGQLFYSRRIGRAPTLFPDTDAAEFIPQTTILGAAKVSGKVAGWSLGSLAALTARERIRFRTGAGGDTTMTAEPSAEYFVARARRELNDGGSLIGGILGIVHRNLDDPIARASLRSDAVSGGADFRHEFGNREWVLRGDVQSSFVRGAPAALIGVQTAANHFFQRPDARHLEVDSAATSLFGYTTGLSLVRQGGEHWRGEVAGALTSPRYEVNDLGFAQRTDRRDLQAQVTYLQNTPGRVFRRWEINNALRTESNFAGEPILTLGGINASAQTPGYWSLFAYVDRFFESYDDRLTRGGPLALRPGWIEMGFDIGTDPRKPVVLEADFSYERSEANGWAQEIELEVELKSSTWWKLTLEPTLERAYVPAQFVTRVVDASYTPTYGVRYIFAPLRQTELSLQTRLNATFTPRLSLETYVQPLISSGDYGDAKQLVAPRTFDFVPYAQPVVDRDFNLRALRGNAVLRWEWREGSTLYVAWQQSREDEAALGDFRFGRDRRALIATRPDNIVVVKINYWLNP